ncbi:MAG: hypothetical protein ACYDEQ_07390 [Desulfocucumaceae bacterium]
MFVKTKYLFFLLLAIITANVGRAMATPPLPYLIMLELKTELTYTETPELDKWTTVHLKATALNDWPKGKFKIHLKSNGVAISPEGEDWPIWENMKNGSVIETDFKIRPYVLGNSEIITDFGVVNNVYFLRLDQDGKFVKLWSRNDYYKHFGVTKDGWPKLTKAQSESVAINNKILLFKPIITKDYVEYRERDITVTISPLPSLNNVSKVVVKKLESFDDKRFKPLLGIGKNSNLHYYNNKQTQATWPKNGLEDRINYTDEFIGPKDEYYYAEFSIQPQITFPNLLQIFIASKVESFISSHSIIISFTLNSEGRLEEFVNKKVPAFEVEK